MYQTPDAFENLCIDLAEMFGDPNGPENEKRALTIAQIELGMALLEMLGLDDEPVVVLWAILSGTPIYHPIAQNWSPAQKHAIANARQILPLSGRVACENALRAYCEISPDFRNYCFNPAQLESSILNSSKIEPANYTQRENIYQECLTKYLDYAEYTIGYPQAGQTYLFDAEVEGESKQPIKVNFTDEQLNLQNEIPTQWFPAIPRSRQPFTLHINELEATAQALDTREQYLAQHYSPGKPFTAQWHNRWSKLRYSLVKSNKKLGQPNTDPLVVDGFSHVAGMVASGKSTLSLLIIAHIILNKLDLRVTLLVSDAPTSIRLANQINWWFQTDPEKQFPVAVPLLGRTTRADHLKAFLASQDYQEHAKRGQAHWGERWLSTVCPLQAVADSDDVEHNLKFKWVKPGKEPCHYLKATKRKKPQEPARQSYMCPLFGVCPSKQAYRDMPQANVWITTPGAMAQSSLPRQLDKRKIRLGELIYDQSDLVIFDEVDVIMDWFDRVYAEQVQLTNGADGIIDRLNVETPTAIVPNRQTSKATRRWVGAEQATVNAVGNILSQLGGLGQHKLLKKWVENSSFTAYQLTYRLARRMCGLLEYDAPDTSLATRRANDQLVRPIMHDFERLFEIDPLREPNDFFTTGFFSGQPTSFQYLVFLLRTINGMGESADDPMIQGLCLNWFNQFYPDTETRLAQLRTDLGASGVALVDTLQSLAHRLHFVLHVALLDQHTKILFWEWANRPAQIEGEEPHRRIPHALRNILPLPALGQKFGIYTSQRPSYEGEENQYDGNNNLAIFAYVNIGRSYVLDFANLRTDLEQQRGPNVLALSGTSYLPDSTRFHVSVDPCGVLLSEDDARHAISSSQFSFSPQVDGDNKPIRVSGESEKTKPLRDIVNRLAKPNGVSSGNLHTTLQQISDYSAENPESWANRGRLLLLVNSYDQAKAVADELTTYNYGFSKDDVFYLVRTKGLAETDGGLVPFGNNNGVRRSDIENFATSYPNSKILVAPMQSIGRAFNILNEQGKAAFGAIYFLTRPMPHPHDTQAVAQEINRKTLDWTKNPDFVAWQQGDGIYGRAEALRRRAANYWNEIEQRKYYRTLRKNPELMADPRRDLAATTAGLIIQAVGRLVRGGVPFLAHFVDAAWSPNRAANPEISESPTTSLLAGVVEILKHYAANETDGTTVGQELYGPLVNAFDAFFANFDNQPFDDATDCAGDDDDGNNDECEEEDNAD